MIKLKPLSIELLCLHRTQYITIVEKAYNKELNATLNKIAKFLPEEIKSIADIGGGIGGMGVLLNEKYGCHVNILEKDKYERSKRIIGYNKAEDFGGYASKKVVEEVWEESGLAKKDLTYIDIDQSFVYPKVDLTISLLSWGFHFPLDTYWKKASINSKYIIADCRKGTEIPEGGKIIIRGQKHNTILWETGK